MTFLIIIIVISVLVFFGRGYLKRNITAYVERKRKTKTDIKTVNTDLIYVPVRSSRVFNFSIEIDEIGDGKATISVIKTK